MHLISQLPCDFGKQTFTFPKYDVSLRSETLLLHSIIHSHFSRLPFLNRTLKKDIKVLVIGGNATVNGGVLKTQQKQSSEGVLQITCS